MKKISDKALEDFMNEKREELSKLNYYNDPYQIVKLYHNWLKVNLDKYLYESEEEKNE